MKTAVKPTANFIIVYKLSGKDKGGPSKDGFLNNMLFPRIINCLYIHTINFITQV